MGGWGYSTFISTVEIENLSRQIDNFFVGLKAQPNRYSLVLY